MNLKIKNKFVAEKLKEVENVSIDFAGQTIFEKIDEGVQYFVNPLNNTDEGSLRDIKSLNAKLESLRTERRKLYETSKWIMGNNRSKLEEIRKLREEIDEA